MISAANILHNAVKKIILEQGLIEDGDLLIVAVSGGVDSLSLLYILDALRGEGFLSFSLFVAHLNHGLRGESAREDAEFVCQEAQKLGLPCRVAAVDCSAYARHRGLSLEDAARRLRYNFLQQLAKRIGANGIAVGHTREDQVETLLLNFLRGTGLSGLTGMKMKRKIHVENLFLIRPLLQTNRKILEQYCREKGFSPRRDETNLETRFLRNKIRLKLLPLLEKEYNPKLRQKMAHLAELLLFDHDFLEGIAAQHFNRLLLKEEDDRLELDGRALLAEHGALQGRILRLAVKRLLGITPREIGFHQIRAILNLMQKGAPHGRLHLPFGLEAARSYTRLKLHMRRKIPPRGWAPFGWAVPGVKALPGKNVLLQAELLPLKKISWPPAGSEEAFFDYDCVLALLQDKKHTVGANTGDNWSKGGPAGEGKTRAADAGARAELQVRTRRAGDYFHPLGAPGKKKLKKYFIDQKIPREERQQIPLILAGGEIIWVAGKQIGHTCRITGETRRVLVLRLVQH